PSPGPHRDLPSFPTRRSSDLTGDVGRKVDHALFEAPDLTAPALDLADQADQLFLVGIALAVFAQFADQIEHAGHERPQVRDQGLDRKSTRLNSSHVKISYAVF